MARDRLIRLSFWTDDKTIKLSIPSKLMFIGLWNYADDIGVIKDDNTSFKVKFFALDDITLEDIESYKQELIKIELVNSYKDKRDGDLLFIKNWFKYQYIQKPTPSKYRLPQSIINTFDDKDLEKYERRIISDEYRNSMIGVSTNRIEEKRIEENEIEEKKENIIPIRPFKVLQKELPSNKNEE